MCNINSINFVHCRDLLPCCQKVHASLLKIGQIDTGNSMKQPLVWQFLRIPIASNQFESTRQLSYLITVSISIGNQPVAAIFRNHFLSQSSCSLLIRFVKQDTLYSLRSSCILFFCLPEQDDERYSPTMTTLGLWNLGVCFSSRETKLFETRASSFDRHYNDSEGTKIKNHKWKYVHWH